LKRFCVVDDIPTHSENVERKMLKEMTTGFRHLDVRDVFIDQLIPCHDMERQPCPFIREHCTENDLWGNDYNPEDNPFGWLNVELALATNGAGHYALSQSDEGPLRDQLKQRYGLSDVYAQSTRATIRQRWTCYPLIGVDETTGDVGRRRGRDVRSVRRQRPPRDRAAHGGNFHGARAG
jgi:hypothetical protein